MAESGPRAYHFSFPETVRDRAYTVCRALLSGIRVCTIRVVMLRRFPETLSEPCLLACNHGSHLDPHLVSVLIPRRLDWITRIEFFGHPVSAWLLHLLGAIPVNRRGVALGAMRTAIQRLRSGRSVGICPEGEVSRGERSVLRGGAIKRGVGFLAVKTGVPVIPCAVLGVDAMRRVGPWLPARRGKVWLNFGEPIRARVDLPPRQAREQLALDLEAALRSLAAELLARCEIPEDQHP